MMKELRKAIINSLDLKRNNKISPLEKTLKTEKKTEK